MGCVVVLHLLISCHVGGACYLVSRLASEQILQEFTIILWDYLPEHDNGQAVLAWPLRRKPLKLFLLSVLQIIGSDI